MIKYVYIFLLIVLSSYSETFSLKDGTVLKGYIYENINCLGNPNNKGVHLVVNKKIYLHDYPTKVRQKIIDHGNGTYTRVEETIPTPAPPVSMSEGFGYERESINPPFVPQCAPARINFIQFSGPSLVKMHNHFSARATFFEKRYNKTRSGNDLFYKKYNKNIASSIHKAYYTTAYKKNNIELKKKWDAKIAKYGSSEFFTVGSNSK